MEGKWHLSLHQEKGSDSSPDHTSSPVPSLQDAAESAEKSTGAVEGSGTISHMRSG